SALDLAKSNLQTSRATYERVIGHPPSNLVEPKPSALVPKTLADGSEISARENPARSSGSLSRAGCPPCRRAHSRRAAALGSARGRLPETLRPAGRHRFAGDDDGNRPSHGAVLYRWRGRGPHSSGQAHPRRPTAGNRASPHRGSGASGG